MFYLLDTNGNVTKKHTFELNTIAPLSVAMGCFDGVHKGHQRLMEKAISKAGHIPAVWTFSEPLSFPFIDNVPTRLSLFGRLGASLAICEDFPTVKALTPEQFVKHLVCDFNVKHFVCGQDFRYGLGRSGNTDTLKADAEKHGATVEIVPHLMTGETPLLMLDNEKISSTLIRKLLAEGDVEKAQKLLGRPFFVSGCVIHGRQIGRRMSLPTVNQKFEDGRINLKHGVYDTLTLIDGKKYPSVTNFGIRPTVSGDKNDVTCETHVIGESLDVYGKNITVEFYRFAREEKKFSSLDELKAAVDADIKRAKDFFGV